MTAAERFSALDSTDGPWIPPVFQGEWPEGAPGDVYPMDTDLTLYWPLVRPAWEEERLVPVAHVFKNGAKVGVRLWLGFFRMWTPVVEE